MVGLWLGSMINMYFGLITILGGLLLGFSALRNDLEEMHTKTKVLFWGAFTFLLILFSAAFLTIKHFLLLS